MPCLLGAVCVTAPRETSEHHIICLGVSVSNPDQQLVGWALSLSPCYRWRHRGRGGRAVQ